MSVGGGINRLWTMVLLAGFVGATSCTTQQEAVFNKKERPSLTPRAATSTATAPATATGATVQAAYGKLPLHFEANQGQSNAQVKFLARGSGYTLFLTATEAVLTLPQKLEGRIQESEVKSSASRPKTLASRLTLRLQLVGANPQPHITGEAELPGKSHYFLGHDPTQWHTNIPTYATVRYQNVYPGIDLVYYGTGGQLEYDFVVAPGADATVIRLAFAGLTGAGVQPAPTLDGTTDDLVLNTAGGELRFHQPRIYQEINGTKHPIAGRYVFLDSETPDSGLRTQHVGFEVAAYDPQQTAHHRSGARVFDLLGRQRLR